MNERFIFISSIAFSLVCAYVWFNYGWNSVKPAIKWGSVAVLILVLGGYAFKIYVRVPAWKDALSLNGQAVLVSPNSARANCFMSTALYELGRDTADEKVKQQIFAEAEYYADRSLSIYRNYLSANQIKSGLVAERYLRTHDLPKLLAEFEEIETAFPETEYVLKFMEYLNGREDAKQLADWYYHVGYEVISKSWVSMPLQCNI